MRKSYILIFVFMLPLIVKAQQIDLPKLLRDSNIAGAQFMKVRKNKNTLQTAGYANTLNQKPIDAASVFEAASLSKVVFAYLCMELVEQKVLNLDKPLIEYFKYPRIAGDSSAKHITARMVLQHRSGFPNWSGSPGKAEWFQSPLKSSFSPGSQWQYSGEGFYYLQKVVEHLSGKPLQVYADEVLFKPLKMSSTHFLWTAELEANNTFGHKANGAQNNRTKFLYTNSAYTLMTNALDYDKFLKQLIHKHLKTMLKNPVSLLGFVKNPEAAHIFWGLGIGIFENDLGQFAWHWGDNGDFKSFFIIHTQSQDRLLWFTNSTNGLKPMALLCESFFGQARWFSPAQLE